MSPGGWLPTAERGFAVSIGEPRHRAVELVFVRIAPAAVALRLGDRAA